MNHEEARIEAVFLQALEIQAPDERAAYLHQSCAGDDELCRRVERMLAAQSQLGNFLHQDAAQIVLASDQPAAEPLGTQIGPYMLLQQIGEGGMGTVFMAEQTQPVHRKVALKLIKSGMDSRQVIARFEAERQALAMMDHVNIARVFDGGATENGRPYFVMELVHGVPINKYCDDNHLTTRERLELFVPVCQAIQHAHQKGIIHRDVKPSNVMITLYDGKPVPKVIDFGVAKATEQKLTERTLFTQFGTIVGTLEYMSPEQAELSALGVDTRSDIYSLGVVLYELLTGSTPLPHKRIKEAAYAEVLRMIREEEPPKPSTRLSDSGEALVSISANRHTEPLKLTKLVRGELDWIVMKCLEKDRNRRYETANGFVQDIQRYLADEPVQACPPSASYRLQKFLRRNQGPVMAASLVLLILIAGIIGTTMGLLHADQNRRKAVIALAAETDARQAERQARDQTMAALRSMTDEIVQNQMARETSLSDQNKEFLRKILQHFDSFAAITSNDVESRAMRAEGYAQVGVIRHRLGELAEAEDALAEAILILKQLAAELPDRPTYRQELARSQSNLGTLLHARGRLTAAKASFADALNIYTQLEADVSTSAELLQNSAGTFNCLGNLLSTMGLLNEAEVAYAEALARQKQLAADFPTRPEFRRDLAISHRNLGNLFHDSGRLKEAEASFAHALAVQDQLAADFPTRPEFRQDQASNHISLGVLLRATGRWEEAEAAYAEARAIYKQLAADFPALPEFRQHLAISESNIARLFTDLGRPEEAEVAYTDALAIQRRLVADFPTRPEFRLHLARSHNNLGVLLRFTGRLKEAEAASADALAIQKQLASDFPSRPEYRQELAGIHVNMGILLRATGRLKEAEAAYTEARAIYRQLADDFPSVPEFRHPLALSENNLANLFTATARPKEAEASYANALIIQQRLVEEAPTRAEFRLQLARTHNNLGSLLEGVGRLPEAEAAYVNALTITKQLTADRRTPLEFRQELASSHNNLGVVFRVTGRLAEAQAAYSDAVTIKRQLAADFPTHPDLQQSLAGTLANLAIVCHQRRDFPAVKKYLEEALPHNRAALEANPRNPAYRQLYRNNLSFLANANAWLNDPAGAIVAVQDIRTLGWDPPIDTYHAACALAQCIPIVQELKQLDTTQRLEAEQSYADQAVAMLRDAVAKGWKDAAQMKKDTDLDALRQREDFQQLLKEVERR